MKQIVTFQCDTCGYVYNETDPGLETKCPMCKVRSYIGTETLEKKRGGSVKCQTCPFTIEVCQVCDEAVGWDEEVELVPLPHHRYSLKPQVVQPKVVVEKEVKEPEAPAGQVAVKIIYLGYSPNMLPHKRYAYKAVSPVGERRFRDDTWYGSGVYFLPEDQWGVGSEQYDVECDHCGSIYDAVGSVGTTIQCPVCKEEEQI
jgi:phage FluMu protein Com